MACAIGLAGFVQPNAIRVSFDYAQATDAQSAGNDASLSAHLEAAFLARNPDQERADGSGNLPLGATFANELQRGPSKVATAAFAPDHETSECARRGMRTSGRHPPQNLPKLN